ncbi:MAG: MoxR family ATPase [Cyclobacteriaceae bacterium]
MSEQDFKSRIDLEPIKENVEKVRNEVGKVIVGQHEMINLLMVALLADGHVLLEGVPGVAKTMTAKTLARTIGLEFSRIQFTPDLMPSDVLGTSVFNMKNAVFEFRQGPIFANIILIDEINRAPAKTQAALFEVMEEVQVTIDGETYPMSTPFLVMATQNPVEQEGTYRLPEAQLDRFLFKIKVDYPTLENEIDILKSIHESRNILNLEVVEKVLGGDEINKLRQITAEVFVEEHLFDYITKIVYETRNHPSLYLGASPRASISLLKGAKALAVINGRDFVTPEDIQQLTGPVMEHRLILTPEKEMEGITAGEVVKAIVEKIEVPR